jgi:hypothetical protein
VALGRQPRQQLFAHGARGAGYEDLHRGLLFSGFTPWTRLGVGL